MLAGQDIIKKQNTYSEKKKRIFFLHSDSHAQHALI